MGRKKKKKKKKEEKRKKKSCQKKKKKKKIDETFWEEEERTADVPYTAIGNGIIKQQAPMDTIALAICSRRCGSIRMEAPHRQT